MLPPRGAPPLDIFGKWRATCHVTSGRTWPPHVPLCFQLFPEPLVCGVAVAAVCTEQIQGMFV